MSDPVHERTVAGFIREQPRDDACVEIPAPTCRGAPSLPIPIGLSDSLRAREDQSGRRGTHGGRRRSMYHSCAPTRRERVPRPERQARPDSLPAPSALKTFSSLSPALLSLQSRLSEVAFSPPVPRLAPVPAPSVPGPSLSVPGPFLSVCLIACLPRLPACSARYLLHRST